MYEKRKSVIAMIISAFGFALMGMFLKLTGDIPIIQKAYIRSIIIMIATFTMFRHSHLKIKEIKHHKLLLLRSALGTVGMMFNYYALDRLILSDASVIFRISTLLLIIFSWIFLKEKASKNQLISIVFAFIGVIFVIKPTFSVEIIPYIAAVLGAIFAAGAHTTVRALGRREHPISVVFYYSTFTSLVLSPFALFTFVPMEPIQWLYALLTGLCGVLGQVGLTISFKYAQAGAVSIYGYLNVVFSALISILIFGMIPDIFSIIGYIIIFGSAYYVYKHP